MHIGKLDTLMQSENLGSFIRFAIVGCINTGVDFVTFTILRSLFDVDYLLCQVAGYTMGLINSFILNKIWTFENRGSKLNTYVQFIKFVGINVASLILSLFFLKLFVDVLGIDVYLSKVIVTVITLVINFFGYKFLVFREG